MGGRTLNRVVAAINLLVALGWGHINLKIEKGVMMPNTYYATVELLEKGIDEQKEEINYYKLRPNYKYC